MGELIFESVTAFQTASLSLENISETSYGWDNVWSQMKHGSVEVQMGVFMTPRLQYSCVSYSNAVLIRGSHPKGSVALSLVRTESPVSSHNQKVEPDELIVMTGGDEVDYLAGGENHIFTLVVEAHFFYQNFFRYFGRSFSELQEGKRLTLTKKYADWFILQMQHRLKYFQNQNNRKSEPSQYCGVEQEILGQLFSIIRMMDKKPVKEKFDLAKVREVLHDNVKNIYTIGDLLEELNISARTMQYHFKQKFGLTPKQYLHYLRLNAIRKELSESFPGEVTISEIALKYGFFNSSHFGSEYKKIFQETPSQTLGRI